MMRNTCKLVLLVVVLGTAVAVASAAPATGLEGVADLQLIAFVRAQRAALAGAPQGVGRDLACCSLDARMQAAVRRLLERAEGAEAEELVACLESLSAADRAAVQPLIHAWRQKLAVAMAQRDLPDDGILARVTALAASCASTQAAAAPLDPAGLAQALAEIRPIVDRRVRGLPVIGTIAGTVGQRPVRLTFDRRQWTIAGSINALPVEIKIDHDQALIGGTLNQALVSLQLDWSPERVALTGVSGNTEYDMVLDWRAGTARGAIGQAATALQFDLHAGWVNGRAANAPVALKYDKITGALSGQMNGEAVALKLVNLDLSDFLQHYYLFAR